MLRKLLVSTALAGVLATGAYAQDANQTETQTPAATDTQSQTGAMETQSGDQQASADMQGEFLQNLSSDQYLASNLTGQSIYASDAQDAESVATIDNWLVDSDGMVVAAIVSTSQTDQERTVAVPFDQISWSMNENGEPRATMSSPDQLASLPAFTTPEQQQMATSGSNMTSSGTTSTGTATGDMAATGGSAAQTDPAAGGTGMAATDGTATQTDPAAGGTGMAASNDTAATGSNDQQMASADSASSSDAPTMVGEGQYLSQNLIGADVKAGPGEDAESIGSINDLVVSSSGQVDAVVIGVGGFLGIGEKDVATPFDMVQLTRGEGSEPQAVFASNRETLEQAPSFSGERPDNGQMASDQSGDASTEMAATGAAAGAAAGNAMESTEPQTMLGTAWSRPATKRRSPWPMPAMKPSRP